MVALSLFLSCSLVANSNVSVSIRRPSAIATVAMLYTCCAIIIVRANARGTVENGY